MTTIAESIAARLAERDALAAELAEVKAQLQAALCERDVARDQRDTARGESAYYRTHYTRSGW